MLYRLWELVEEGIGMREGDIESLRRAMKDEGRPLKSKIIRDKERTIHYTVDKKDKVRVTDEH